MSVGRFVPMAFITFLGVVDSVERHKQASSPCLPVVLVPLVESID